MVEVRERESEAGKKWLAPSSLESVGGDGDGARLHNICRANVNRGTVVVSYYSASASPPDRFSGSALEIYTVSVCACPSGWVRLPLGIPAAEQITQVTQTPITNTQEPLALR